MRDTSRGLRESVVHGLAKVGLVWALAVLGTLFVVSAAYGNDAGSYTLGTSGAAQSFGIDAVGTAPRTIGLALALVVLAAGLTVLAVGAAPGPARTTGLALLPPLPAYDGTDELRVVHLDDAPSEQPADLSLALALGLSA